MFELMVGLIVVFVLVMAMPSLGAKVSRTHFVPIDSLLTKYELSFWRRIEPHFRNHERYAIVTKIRIGDIVSVKGGTNRARFGMLMKINKKHVDYVIVERKTYKPLLIIELDDRSHLQKKRKQRDDFVDKVFNDAGIPILHVTKPAFLKSDDIIDIISTPSLINVKQKKKKHRMGFGYMIA